MDPTIFKCCSFCHFIWKDRIDFLEDTALYLNGYTPNFETPDQGLLYFTHEKDTCHTTLALPVLDFMDLSEATRYNEIKARTSACKGLCLIQNNLEHCEAHCKFAYIRDLMQVILKWPKKERS